MALIKYLETALLSFHDTWQQVMALADEFKFRSVGGTHALIGHGYFNRTHDDLPLAVRSVEITGRAWRLCRSGRRIR